MPDLADNGAWLRAHSPERGENFALKGYAGRRYSISIGIVLLAVLDTFRRILYGARPIDSTMLVVEILVLVLIAWEFVGGRFHRWKLQRRINRLFPCFTQGQQLYQNVPAVAADLAASTAWVEQVEDWTQRTSKLLASYSSKASVSFLHESGGLVNRDFHRIHTTAYAPYVQLLERLNSLRAILEKPDIYF